MDIGFTKVGAASPRLKVANPRFNADRAYEAIAAAEAEGVQVLVLPELFISGYTCGDLFGQRALLDESLAALVSLSNRTEKLDICFAIGLPFELAGRLYNCAAVVKGGKILGIVPKVHLPNTFEYYEKRWFTSGAGVEDTVKIAGQDVPFGSRTVFCLDGKRLVVGVEICEDLWVPNPPSSYLALAGANLILNPSASNELVTKSEYRRSLVMQQSGRCVCAYAYSGSGVHESTTDVVFSGACLIAVNGRLSGESERFAREGSHIYTCVDIEALDRARASGTGFMTQHTGVAVRRVYDTIKPLDAKHFDQKIDPRPFVPEDPRMREERCEEILSIQTAGLCGRLEHTGSKKLLVGVSGGLDSTLSLLVAVKAAKILGRQVSDVIGVTMPGFGTTDRTYTNAVKLVSVLGATLREIDISASCMQHFKDIGHDPDIHDTTYENAQARERTQILMDLANKEKGIVIGTGDLSELAMGWTTYNGDHMSMYNVNASVPKTLVRHLVRYEAEKLGGEARDILLDILDTPVSPELLPPDQNGQIAQKTEEQIGPYELHDFFLYHTLRFGTRPEKLRFMAERAFAGVYSADEVKKWQDVFYSRFFAQQFKRSCLPDGPKVGTVSLSPRGDWRMPSDADGTIWKA